jgi:hypothetical protein
VGPHPPATHHRKAPNLHKRHTLTDLDAKELTSEQLRLQFYCSRTGDFFPPSLSDLLPRLLFDHPTSLSFFFSFPLYSIPFIFPSLSLFYPSFSELEDEIAIKGKTEELLVEQLKTCEKKMQELTDCIKRPNLRIMGIEGEEVQAKGMRNMFNKIITENFPNLEKTMPIQVQEASRTPNRPDQNRTTP